MQHDCHIQHSNLLLQNAEKVTDQQQKMQKDTQAVESSEYNKQQRCIRRKFRTQLKLANIKNDKKQQTKIHAFSTRPLVKLTQTHEHTEKTHRQKTHRENTQKTHTENTDTNHREKTQRKHTDRKHTERKHRENTERERERKHR